MKTTNKKPWHKKRIHRRVKGHGARCGVIAPNAIEDGKWITRNLEEVACEECFGH